MNDTDTQILLEELDALFEHYQYESEQAEKNRFHNPSRRQFCRLRVSWIDVVRIRVSQGEWPNEQYKQIIAERKNTLVEEYNELMRLSRKFGMELVPKT